MNNLLNSDVIKAAASSPLGILSLLCLIIGVVSLGLFRKTLIWAKLIVFVLYSPEFADLGHRLCASRTCSRGEFVLLVCVSESVQNVRST